MKIDDWPATAGLNEQFRTLRELGLESNVAELDAFGFTVIENVLTTAEVSALRDSIVAVATRRTGRAIDDAGESHRGVLQVLEGMLAEGEVFEHAVQHPVAMAMLSYLLGDSYILSSLHAMVKGPETAPLYLHSDSMFIPTPLPRYAQVANATFVLTPYSQGGGAIRFVPGSHRQCRHPTPAEIEDESAMVAIDADPGDLVVFHGNTWHGAAGRVDPGLRINLIYYAARMYIRTQEWYLDKLAPEVFERNPPRFRDLLGDRLPFTDTRYDQARHSASAPVSRAQHR
jgi:ectoine hydroxylase-related dioxygenase (phytanoyl-CoA dioxygenase family)